MHPFDIKTVLFAKHAQHVVLIHFPIALFIIGVPFDFLAQWKKAAPAGCGGLLQHARRGNRNIPRGSHRNSRVVVGSRGAETEWHSLDASSDGVRVKRPDLGGVVHP